MANKPGHVAHNRLPVELHVARGTYRQDRHGVRPASGGPVWTPTDTDLARVGTDGRALIDRLVSVFEFGVLEGEIVIEMALVADRLGEVRNRRDLYSPEDRDGVDKREVMWQRSFGALLQILRARMT